MFVNLSSVFLQIDVNSTVRPFVSSHIHRFDKMTSWSRWISLLLSWYHSVRDSLPKLSALYFSLLTRLRGQILLKYQLQPAETVFTERRDYIASHGRIEDVTGPTIRSKRPRVMCQVSNSSLKTYQICLNLFSIIRTGNVTCSTRLSLSSRYAISLHATIFFNVANK